MFTRRQFMRTVAVASTYPLAGRIDLALGNDLPSSLSNAKAQFYNFILTFAQGQGISTTQKLVLNSLILPLDIAADTPYHNEELFRQYSDRTFRGGTEGLQGFSPASQAERFSAQYKSLINAVSLQIDQNHPEIQHSLNDLESQLGDATTALTTKEVTLDGQWDQIATSRHLTPGTNDYELERITWQAQVRYGDQIAGLSNNIDRINSQIDAVRRKVYTPGQAAVLDNISVLGTAYNVARPWNAQTERSQKNAGAPLTDVMLADVNKLAPAIFDSSPLILPVGDLTTFLAANGSMGFDTGHQSSELDGGTSSWAASGGGSFLGWSLGGGGSGSSSFSHSMSQLNTVTLSFTNMAEYIIDRSSWFNPAVLQDKTIFSMVKDRTEILNLQYIAVGLILVRGTNLQLRFSQQVNSSDFSQSSWNANGGGSFLGFSFGVGGGGSSSKYTITNDANWTNIGFMDDPTTTRVIGVRVEPFLTPPKQTPETLEDVAARDPNFKNAMSEFLQGNLSYIDLQKEKLNAIKALQ